MPKWKRQDETVCMPNTVCCAMAADQEEARLICAAHNADIDALTAERDTWKNIAHGEVETNVELRGKLAELQRRLDAVVASLKPGDQPNYMDPKYNPSKMPPLTEYNLDCMWYGMRKQSHARALAIAEGREG